MTKRTKDLEAAVLTALRSGHPLKIAAYTAGINPRTLQEWIADDENFEQQVGEARASWAAFHLANINRSASNGNWLASAWALERSLPELYSRVDRTYAIMHIEVTETIAELKREGYEISQEDEARMLKEYKLALGAERT